VAGAGARSNQPSGACLAVDPRNDTDTCPPPATTRASWKVKLLVDHREPLVAERPWTSNRLGWQLHQLDPTWTGDHPATRPKPAPQHRMARAGRPGGVQVSTICQEAQVAAIGSLAARLGQLDRERCHRITQSAPNLLALPGGGTLTAAKPSRGWQPAAACRPAPYRDHPAAPARPRQTYDQRRRAQGDATGEAVPAPSGAASPEPSTGHLK
jgi:hypothetical protein